MLARYPFHWHLVGDIPRGQYPYYKKQTFVFIFLFFIFLYIFYIILIFFIDISQIHQELLGAQLFQPLCHSPWH
jgi:hypothetical protein